MFGEPIKIQTQQVEDLVDRPIQIVESVKIYVDLECVWGNTSATVVTRDSTGTRYRNHRTSFFGMDQ